MNEILIQSVLICAHPDDEVLWFSSVLDKVDKVIICFMGVRSDPDCRIERQSALNEYPLKNVLCLGLDESETFYGVDWDHPVTTEYGLEIADKKYPDRLYRENYSSLIKMLEPELEGYHNVFTHNPWGEYGSDEHVQIHRAVTDIQKSGHYTMWFPNYVSNKSCGLMASQMDTINLSYITLQTNKELSARIQRLYQKHKCWTWYDDWQWFEEETFLSKPAAAENAMGSGRTVPMNFIRVPVPEKQARRKRFSGSSLVEFLTGRG